MDDKSSACPMTVPHHRSDIFVDVTRLNVCYVFLNNFLLEDMTSLFTLPPHSKFHNAHGIPVTFHVCLFCVQKDFGPRCDETLFDCELASGAPESKATVCCSSSVMWLLLSLLWRTLQSSLRGFVKEAMSCYPGYVSGWLWKSIHKLVFYIHEKNAQKNAPKGVQLEHGLG